MNKPAPIVAELGRPETAAETAERKAAATQAYRSSKTMRNLIAAMLVTLAVVAVIIFSVPRGEAPPREPIDVASIARDVETSRNSPAIVPEVGDSYQVNAAALEPGNPAVWKVTLAPSSDEARGFVNVAQAFNAEASWAPTVIGGIAPTDSTVIGGLTWDVYDIPNPGQSGNVSYALGTQAGSDYVLLYGALSADDTAAIAESLTPQLQEIAAAS